MGGAPAFLTRGYGGRLAGPHAVDADRDSAADVGDEALLLARDAPTMLARTRPDGAKAIEATGASVIIMDDGFQNPSLVKDLSLVAVDGGAGLGNERVFPAGPLRAPLAFQLARTDAVVVIGGEGAPQHFINGGTPQISAHLAPIGDAAWLRAQPVVAFCGIGRPGKFFATLRENGAALVGTQPFPDHHAFSEADAATLLQKAADTGAILVTTEKDLARIPATSGALGRLKASARALPVSLHFAPGGEDTLKALIQPVLQR